MTDLDLTARRIRDAFEHDLADYQAPAGLAERARLGGLRRARSRRLRRWMFAAGAACAAIGLAAALAVPSASRARPVHVHLAAWSVDTNSNGTVTVTVHQLAHPAKLQQTLAQAGVPALVTPGQICGGPQTQKALAKTGAAKNEAAGVIINPAAIPSGTRILFGIFFSRGTHGKVGWGLGLVHAGARLHCYTITGFGPRHPENR
jgi:hypothetical protein